jgi:hypothetical protein
LKKLGGISIAINLAENIRSKCKNQKFYHTKLKTSQKNCESSRWKEARINGCGGI